PPQSWRGAVHQAEAAVPAGRVLAPWREARPHRRRDRPGDGRRPRARVRYSIGAAMMVDVKALETLAMRLKAAAEILDENPCEVYGLAQDCRIAAEIIPPLIAALVPFANAAEPWAGKSQDNQLSIALGMLRHAGLTLVANNLKAEYARRPAEKAG